MAIEQAAELLRRGYDPEFIARAQRFLHEPGISVVAPAQLAAETAEIHAMHDPTEGGVATGLVELAHAAGTGLSVDFAAIQVPEESAVLCREFGLDPLGTLASGAILLAAPERAVPSLMRVLSHAGYPTAAIGQIMPPGCGLVARRGSQVVPWPAFAVDEIARVFTASTCLSYPPLPRTASTSVPPKEPR